MNDVFEADLGEWRRVEAERAAADAAKAARDDVIVDLTPEEQRAFDGVVHDFRQDQP